MLSRPASQVVFAHTSPIYLEIEGKPRPFEERSKKSLQGHLERMLEWVQNEARCETDKQREDLARPYELAREELWERASRKQDVGSSTSQVGPLATHR